MRYFILGLPGSGKSYWGRIWSEKIKLPYFDLDEVIENNEGESIKDIFRTEGEEYFRNLETFYLNKLIDNYKAFILSTGGGTPCFNDNMKLMNETGLTIFLNPPIEETVARIWTSEEITKRPLFSDCNSSEDALEILIKLNEKRISFYQEVKKELTIWNENSLRELK